MTMPHTTSRAWLALALALLVLVAGCRSKREEPKVLYPVPEFSLTDQTGKRFGKAELTGQVWVAAFFFTRCPTVCPRITKRMLSLQKQAKARGLAFQLVSISVDPDHDTPPVLTAYAEKYAIDLGNWTLLTGDAEVIKKTSVEGFKVALEGKADPKKEDYGILHGSHLVLVDKGGQIRGYYRTSADEDMQRLLDHVALLAR